MKRRWIFSLLTASLVAGMVGTSYADVTTSITGEYRLRPEFRDNADFDKNATDPQNFYGQRVRVGLTANIASDLSGFVQFQDTRNWGGDSVLTDSTTSNANQGVDLHQAFITLNNINGLPLGLKVGRQELSYGDQRLVGGFGWSNNGRAFDAIKLSYAHSVVDIDFWTAKVVESNATSSAGKSSADDTDFYGIYSTFGKLIPDNNLQVYLLYKRAGSQDIKLTDNSTAFTLDDLAHYTIGARLAGKVSNIGIDYTGELAMQSGEAKISAIKQDISANAYALEVGYAIPTVAWSPRVAIEYDHASGTSTSDSNSNKIKTFDNLYPTNHMHYGYMDYMGWSNMNDIALKVSAKPTDKWSVFLAYHMFSLADKEDYWFNAGGNANATDYNFGSGLKDDIGNELDIVAKHSFNKNLKLEGGVSQFFAGDVIEDSVKAKTPAGAVEDSTWAYLMGTVSF